MVLFDVVGRALENQKLCGADIDILVVNCSIFHPTPSLCSMIANKFKMKSNLESYNLGGMGCSAGLIGISLACDLLSLNPYKIALVVSTENLTQNFYLGVEKEMMIQNILFRMGGSAVVLTGKKFLRNNFTPLFKIERVCRTSHVLFFINLLILYYRRTMMSHFTRFGKIRIPVVIME